MTVDEFDYALPPELVAQVPAARRDVSRLMVLGKRDGGPRHRRFAEVVQELRRGDLLVVNDTKVLPARLRARKPTGGAVSLLLVERVAAEEAGETWLALLDASRPPHAGSRLELPGGGEAEVLGRDEDGWRLRLTHPSEPPLPSILAHGEMPLPPYIHRGRDDPRRDLDAERYQTVFAREPGAVAAPTAGLHFSREVLHELEVAGVRVAALTLHVGPGTFLPVRTPRLEEHRMHAEVFCVPEATAGAIERTREAGGRIVAVGTTVVRALETAATESGRVQAGEGRTTLFVVPGFRFRVVDALVTNFHLPRSTLLMLVSAFVGRERLLDAYACAVRERYRFYSYGDAMLVIDP